MDLTPKQRGRLTAAKCIDCGTPIFCMSEYRCLNCDVHVQLIAELKKRHLLGHQPDAPK